METKVHYANQATTLDIITALMSDVIIAERTAKMQGMHEGIDMNDRVDLDPVKERNHIRYLSQECWRLAR